MMLGQPRDEARRMPAGARGRAGCRLRANGATCLASAVGSAYFDAMLYRLRAILLPALLALGLVVQGMVMPAMASTGSASAASCPAMDGNCAKPDLNHHVMTGACQVTCPVPVALPDLSAGASLVSPTERFVMTGAGLPAGLIRAPEPFPPRPFLPA